MFAGAEGVKTAEQEQIYGGAAGSWYDPCYHQICDNLSTVLTGVLPIERGRPRDGAHRRREAGRAPQDGGRLAQEPQELSGAAAYAVYYYATSKDAFGTKPGGTSRPSDRTVAAAGTATGSTSAADPLIRNAHGAVAVWSHMTVKTSDCTVVRPGATYAGARD